MNHCQTPFILRLIFLYYTALVFNANPKKPPVKVAFTWLINQLLNNGFRLNVASTGANRNLTADDYILLQAIEMIDPSTSCCID